MERLSIINKKTLLEAKSIAEKQQIDQIKEKIRRIYVKGYDKMN